MELKANSSNNTVYADADGHIAYFHPQFVPKRDDRFDWTRPVDGSDPATEWHGLHGIDDSPHVIDPRERLDPEHQRLALLGGRRRTARSGRTFPSTWTRSARARAGCTRSACSTESKGLHARAAPRRGLRQLSHRVRAARAAAAGRLRRDCRRSDSLKATLAGADRGAPRVGLPLVGGSACRRRSRCSGATRCGAHTRRGGTRRASRSTTTWPPGRPRGRSSRRARRRRRPAHPRLRHAGRRRGARSTASSASPATSCSRSATRGPSIPVPFTSARWGSLASFGARTVSRHEAVVRDQRQQLRRGGRVREGQRAGQGGDGGRGERRSPVATLQRPGRALRDGQSARRLLLSGAARGTHRAAVPAGRVIR